jgi:hypothetical protein
MQQIALYLDKFKGLLPPDYIVRMAVCEVLNNDFKIEVTITDIKVAKTKIYISADGYVKSEIFQNHQEILKKLLSKLTTYKINRVG